MWRRKRRPEQCVRARVRVWPGMRGDTEVGRIEERATIRGRRRREKKTQQQQQRILNTVFTNRF